MKVLLTTTSFQDTPGKHHDVLNDAGWEIDTLRGPLKEKEVLNVVANYDGIICGDDEITRQVLVEGKKGKLKAISKYGIGLDKIDLDAINELKIPLKNTPGVNHITVAEHTMMLILCAYKNTFHHFTTTGKGDWERKSGNELFGKRVLIIGYGRIGKEVVRRLQNFGVEIWLYDILLKGHKGIGNNLKVISSLDIIDSSIDIISLHLPLNGQTKGLIDRCIFKKLKNNILIIYTSRASIIDRNSIEIFLKENDRARYFSDVWWEEPMNENDKLSKLPNVSITPHVSSRTLESVTRQGIASVMNLREIFNSLI